MILTCRQIVWTPIFAGNSLSIALDRTFAEACAGYTPGAPKEFVEGVWQLMGNTLPVIPSNFLDFHEGILPKSLYAGRDGLWLALDRPFPSSSAIPLMYHGHNEDRHSADRLWLLRAFAAWATGASTLLHWN